MSSLVLQPFICKINSHILYSRYALSILKSTGQDSGYLWKYTFS